MQPVKPDKHKRIGRLKPATCSRVGRLSSRASLHTIARVQRRSIILLLLISVALANASIARAELRPNEIALIVNRNVPESLELAKFYADARKIPDGRIIALDLPVGEEISFDEYERRVVPAVKLFLRDHKLEPEIKCLVAMYGVPLKIAARVNSPQDAAELARLKAIGTQLFNRVNRLAHEIENFSKQQDPTFNPQDGASIDDFARRIELAAQAATAAVQRVPDLQKRDALTQQLATIVRAVKAPVDLHNVELPTTTPATNSSTELLERRFDPAGRAALRALAAKEGIVSFARIVIVHIEYLTTDATDAAFDSELALLWWPNYARRNWIPNALNHRFAASRTPPVLMTARLDGETPELVRSIITTSIQIEEKGLNGNAVIDAGGAEKLDPQRTQQGFWPFDETFLRLAALLESKTSLKVMLDRKGDVLPPNSATDVAIYTGWYNVNHYVPSCTFAAGAVGYHVASFELTSLRDATNSNWCRGLLKNGVVATLGPVSEPFLHAFPPPDEFFPLLLTGKLTLAEVYWRTTPLASWKMGLVGDPLYTPFRTNPMLKIEDLPEPLRPN